MVKSLPGVMQQVRRYAYEKMEELKKSSMTGNYINSFGIAIYRNGDFIACATTNDLEGKDPIQFTLAEGDKFFAKQERYDNTEQEDTFTAPEGSMRHIFAHEEVVRWLRRYRPRVSKNKDSLAYRIVTVVDYAKMVGGDKVLLQIADDIEGRGGDIREFKFA